MRLGRCIGTVALALGAAVGPLATSSDAASVVTSSSLLAPDVASTGRTTLYSATWFNQTNPTLTNTVIVVTLPSGSVLVSADPAVCTTSLPSGPSGPVVVTCPRQNLASGASLTQQLLIQVPTVATTATVTAFLKGDEQASDRDKSHTDMFPAPDRTLTTVPGNADAAGGCLRDGEPPLATRPGLSATNPLITTAGLAGSSGLVCVPVTVQERAATSPTEACGAGATCTTDIAITDFIQVTSQLPASPVRLTLTVVATNKNMTWYKNGVPVLDCAGATSLPPGVSACITSRSKPSSNSVRLGVVWRAGPDPTWRG
jgi:hypothetical protein